MEPLPWFRFFLQAFLEIFSVPFFCKDSQHARAVLKLSLFLSLGLLGSAPLFSRYLLPSDPFCSLSLKYESDELEKSVYQDYDSDSDVPEELKQDYVDEQTGDAPLKRSVPSPLV